MHNLRIFCVLELLMFTCHCLVVHSINYRLLLLSRSLMIGKVLHTNFSGYSCLASWVLSFNELFNPQFIKLISMLWGFILCVPCINTFGWYWLAWRGHIMNILRTTRTSQRCFDFLTSKTTCIEWGVVM